MESSSQKLRSLSMLCVQATKSCTSLFLLTVTRSSGGKILTLSTLKIYISLYTVYLYSLPPQSPVLSSRSSENKSPENRSIALGRIKFDISLIPLIEFPFRFFQWKLIVAHSRNIPRQNVTRFHWLPAYSDLMTFEPDLFVSLGCAGNTSE